MEANNAHFFCVPRKNEIYTALGTYAEFFSGNDAEHTLQTVMIAHGLAVIREKFFMNPAMRSIAPYWPFIMMREKSLQGTCPLP